MMTAVLNFKLFSKDPQKALSAAPGMCFLGFGGLKLGTVFCIYLYAKIRKEQARYMQPVRQNQLPPFITARAVTQRK